MLWIALGLLVAAAIVVLYHKIIPTGFQRSSGCCSMPVKSAAEILQDRYKKGELSEEEFNRLLEALNERTK